MIVWLLFQFNGVFIVVCGDVLVLVNVTRLCSVRVVSSMVRITVEQLLGSSECRLFVLVTVCMTWVLCLFFVIGYGECRV